MSEKKKGKKLFSVHTDYNTLVDTDWGIRKDAWVGFDLRPVKKPVDPFPKFTQILEKEGWEGGLRHIKKKLKNLF